MRNVLPLLSVMELSITIHEGLGRVGGTDIRKEEVECARSRWGGGTTPLSSRAAVGANSTAISAEQ